MATDPTYKAQLEKEIAADDWCFGDWSSDDFQISGHGLISRRMAADAAVAATAAIANINYDNLRKEKK